MVSTTENPSALLLLLDVTSHPASSESFWIEVEGECIAVSSSSDLVNQEGGGRAD